MVKTKNDAEQLRPHIEWDLKDKQFEDATLHTRAFTNIEYTEEDINKFVCQTSCYCKETARWALPKSPCEEDQLAESLQMIMDQVISHFDIGQRTIYNAYGSPSVTLQHYDPDYDRDVPTYLELRTVLAFSIQAIEKDCTTPNNFPDLHPDEDGYAQVVSAFQVKTEESNFDPEGHKIQVAYYASKIFQKQGNRQLVNCLIVSEEYMSLYVFGRDGLHYSQPFNIHDDPNRFVRFILGAASTKAEVVGFDSTIFFRGGKRWIQSVDLQNNAVDYEVVGTSPVFEQSALGWHGATWWKVKDATGNLFLLKDSWKEPVLTHEYELLQDAKGLGGVGQIVGYQTNLTSTHRLRRINTQSTSSEDIDKELSRTVMEYYGDTLAGFTSCKQLLEAFDDAISGYKNLYDRNILYRDISINNILLGKPGAQSPNRGVLVDLAMATRLGQQPNEEDKDRRKTDTHTFQSVNILRSYSAKRSSPHGYMDDLQSFFYVLCWVCANYAAPNTRVSTSAIPDWDVYNAHEAVINKGAFYVEPLTENVKLTPFFGEPFYMLLEDLQHFFKPYVNNFRVVEPPTLEHACSTVQGYVRTALVAIEMAHDNNTPAAIAVPKACSSVSQSLLAPPSARGSTKRLFNGSEEECFPSKKIKLSVSVPRNIS